MVELLRKTLARLSNEPALVFGVVCAAANAVTVQTWQGYAAAIGTALLRFIVTGPFTQ